MNTIEQKIRIIAERMGNVNYLYDGWGLINLRADKTPTPIMVNVLPVSGALNMGGRRITESQDCIIGFLDKTEFDFDGTQNDAIIERMKKLAIEFILTMNESGLFEPISGEVPMSIEYNLLDVNLTGVVLTLRLEEKQGIVMCFGKPIKDYFNE